VLDECQQLDASLCHLIILRRATKHGMDPRHAPFMFAVIGAGVTRAPLMISQKLAKRTGRGIRAQKPPGATSKPGQSNQQTTPDRVTR
jgi:hypothetical protein